MRGGRASRLPERLADSVGHELGRLGDAPGDGAGLAEIVRAWPGAVGETIARNAWPARFARDGALIVHTASSTWAFELTQLAETVRGQLGPTAPSRLKFVVGAIPESGAETATSVHQELARPGPEDVSEAARIASGIADPGLRAAVARAAAASLASSRRGAGSTGPSDTL